MFWRVATYPAIKATQLLALLTRKPLDYEIVRRRGSHRRLESRSGYPPPTFAFHDSTTIPPGLVRKILERDVGLTEDEARALL